jgi:NAD(P)-dependent dehydrogenase (short-subunit alcohol dehydrogenase family)
MREESNEPSRRQGGADLGRRRHRGGAPQALQRIPLGRMASAEDIAKGIVFLASDDAAFMTGAGLVVDGGITAQ